MPGSQRQRLIVPSDSKTDLPGLLCRLGQYWDVPSDQTSEREEWYRSLPRKRMAAGAVIRNAEGAILIVKPTYKDVWELPGGVVEDEESPREACRRELKEELGLDLNPGPLLCVDYCSTTDDGYSESLQFLFDSGVVTSEEPITLNKAELSEARWLPIEDAAGLMGGRVARRLLASHQHIGSGGVYLEDQADPERA